MGLFEQLYIVLRFFVFMDEVVVGGRYRHFKGGEYTVLNIARDSEGLGRVVVYRAEYEIAEFGKGSVWVRDYDDFASWKILENGEKVKRFELVDLL